MLQPHFSKGSWWGGGHSGRGIRSLQHRLIGASPDTLLKEPGLCSPTLAEAISALWGNWSVSEMEKFWEKSTK